LADLTKVGLKPEQTAQFVSNAVKIPRMRIRNHRKSLRSRRTILSKIRWEGNKNENKTWRNCRRGIRRKRRLRKRRTRLRRL
jgi:hypothetical protein